MPNDNIWIAIMAHTFVGKYRLVLNCFSVDESVTVEKKRMTDQKRTSGT